MMSDTKGWIKDKGLELIIGGILIGNFYWFDAKFDHINDKFDKIDERFVVLEKDVAVIKAIMLMKNILPAELAKKEGVE